MLTLSVIGTRPEAIKMAPVIKELAKYPDRARSLVCITGQHREMLDQVLGLFGTQADYDLDLMQPNQSLSQLTAKLFEGLSSVVEKTKPDWILAQGDTTTVLVASLVAFYHRIQFGHIEAGLRTGDLAQPFPEEMNRCIADRLATMLFAPTDRARQALLQEGHERERIRVTGNTVVDALLEVAARPFNWASFPVPELSNKRLVLITAHRRESFGDAFREMCHSIRALAERFVGTGLHFIYPVHLNPNVRLPVSQILSGLENVSLIEPLDYLSMIHLMRRAELILTDSGGIQEEAPTFGVPLLVMRETTERPEALELGMVQLVGTRRESIISHASRILEDPTARSNWPRGANPYGDGKAAERIVASLLEESRSGPGAETKRSNSRRD